MSRLINHCKHRLSDKLVDALVYLTIRNYSSVDVSGIVSRLKDHNIREEWVRESVWRLIDYRKINLDSGLNIYAV